MLKRIGICIWILKRNIFKFHIVFVVISFFQQLTNLDTYDLANPDTQTGFAGGYNILHYRIRDTSIPVSLLRVLIKQQHIVQYCRRQSTKQGF